MISRYFQDERLFMYQLTMVAESLRFISDKSRRKSALPALLEQLQLPKLAYVPLCHATDAFCRVLRIPFQVKNKWDY